MKTRLFWFIALCGIAGMLSAQNQDWATPTVLEDSVWRTGDVINSGEINYYKLSIPDNGSVRVEMKLLSTDQIFFNVQVKQLDLTDTTFTTMSGYYLRFDETWTGIDTSDVAVCLTAGDYYIVVDHDFYNSGTYNIRYVYVPTDVPNDVEPNDTWEQAIEINIGDTATGNLNFPYGEDDTDWYKLTIPEDGTLHIYNQLWPGGDRGFGSDGRMRFSMTVYEQRNDTTVSNRCDFKGDQQWDGDTVSYIYRTDLVGGTYYLKAYADWGYGSYRFTSRFVPYGNNDAEPNDTWEQAVAINEGDTVRGHLGFVNNKNESDAEDWYKLTIPENGAVHFYSQAKNVTDNYYWYWRIYMYKNNDVLGSDYLSTDENTGDSIWHHSAKNLAAGTYYLKTVPLYPTLYRLRYELHPAPRVDFRCTQNLFDFSFINLTDSANSYQWSFGDGYSSKLVSPTHTYRKPGVYSVQLIATNENGCDTISKEVTIRGLQRVEATRGGQGLITLYFHAGGLTDNSKLILRKNGTEVEATNIFRLSTGCMQGTFNMTDGELGKWDAMVYNAGEKDTMLLEKAFTLEPATGANVFTDLQGREKVLIGRWQTYTATIGNKGNTDAYYQTLWIVTPHDTIGTTDVRLPNIAYVLPEDSTIRALLLEMPEYFTFDTIDGEARSVRVYAFMFYCIPAHTEFSIQVQVRSYQDFEVSVFETEPFFDKESETAASAPQRVAAESEGDCIGNAILSFAANKALDFAADQIPGAGCAKSVIQAGYQGAEAAGTLSGGGKVNVFNLLWTVSTTTWSCAKDFVPVLKAYKFACGVVDFAIDVANNYQADQECKKKKGKKKGVKTVTSLDPNEMIGPTGFGEGAHIDKKTFNYNILFENKNTATAAAQEVIITDSIDKSKFDIHSLHFTEFGYGDTLFTPVQDENSFVQYVTLSDTTLLRISGFVDTVSNVIEWQFITLDPTTMDLTETLAGFLPPNSTSPEGEGFVSFSVALLDSVQDGDVIENFADIIFDMNAPIRTNTYVNTIDQTAPVSTVASVSHTAEAGKYKVVFSGADKGAGILRYDLYAVIEGETPTLLGSAVNTDSLIITLTDGKYGFYSIATDNLYFQEADKAVSDLSFNTQGEGINETSAQPSGISIYPNPASNYVEVELRDNVREDAVLDIYDFAGQLLFRQAVQTGKNRISLSDFVNGIYLVRCGEYSKRLIVK